MSALAPGGGELPSRVIRGEINASRSLARVSMLADLTFRALIVAVDDYGRFDADPLMLKAALFPRRADVDAATVRAWVDELVAAGCVGIYEHQGDEFLHLVGWEQHRGTGRRAAKSKYPEPPSEISPEIPGNPRSEKQADDPVPEIRVSYRESGSGKREAGSEGDAPAEPGATALETEASAPVDRGLVLLEKPVAKAPPEVPPDAAKFADDFVAALVRVHDGFRPPTPAAFESWRQDARRMLAIDKRPIDEARALAAWLFAGTDEGAVFWRSVVLSVPKFREKYEQMKAKARIARNGGKGAAHHGSALLAWANS